MLAEGYRLQARADEGEPPLRIRRVALYPNHDSSAARRLANYASFGVSASLLGLSALRDVDAVWVNYSPITVAWPMWAAQLAYKVPSVVHVLDLWPDTLLAGGFARGGWQGRVADRMMHAWCDRIYRSASSVAYISPGVGGLLQSRGVPAAKLAYVPMWADEAIFTPSTVDLRRELGIDESQKVLLYAGALGEAQGLTSLIDACSRVKDPEFLCLIAGSGISETALRRRADELGLTNIRFLGRLPTEKMSALMATADMCHIGLRPHSLSSVTMPSKTQAILAAGKPAVVAAEGDVADVARDSGAAFVTDGLTPEAVAAAIDSACRLGREGLRELGLSARDYYHRTFSASRGVERIEQLLIEAASSRR
jgi:glycosyltransferase involved in cell wall biosynthesis